MNRIFSITTLLLTALGAWSSNTLAANDGYQAAIDYRSSIMIIYKWHIGPMFGMATGKIPYDHARFQQNAEGLANAASLDMLAGFPEGSTDDESEAKAEIWQNWSTFEEKFLALQTESAKLAKVAAGQDRNASVAQLKKTGGTCDGCHDDFREE